MQATASPGQGYTLRTARDAKVNKEIDTTPLPMGGIWFEGPAFVGGRDIRIEGTAQSIYARLLEINPDYNPWDFADYQADMEAQGITKESQANQTSVAAAFASSDDSVLRKRDETKCEVGGKSITNWHSECKEGLRYLHQLKGFCGAPRGTDENKCKRVSCSNTCGLFLCNEVSVCGWLK